MKHTTTNRWIRPKTAVHRSRRLTVVALAALSFAIATVDTASAISEFALDSSTTTASQEQAGH